MKKLIFIMLAILFISCGEKRTLTEVESPNDSIQVYKYYIDDTKYLYVAKYKDIYVSKFKDSKVSTATLVDGENTDYSINIEE